MLHYKWMKILPKNNSGQALLLTLFSMAVVLTIALSIISRSVTDISITTGGEDALRAFSAAEAGVEQAIIAGSGDSFTFDNNASFTSSVTDFSSGISEFIYPFGGLAAGDSGIIWYVSHDSDGNLEACSAMYPCYTGKAINICWGKQGTPDDSAVTPAVEISTFYLDGTYKIHRVAIDPNAIRRGSNNFIAPDTTKAMCQIEGVGFAFQKNIDLKDLSNMKFARIRFLYNTESAPFGVEAAVPVNALFPSQGRKIDSQGSAGSSNRRVEVIQGYGELPAPFANALFSEGGIVQ